MRSTFTATSDTAPYFLTEMVTYECNGDLVDDDGSDMMVATCQAQGDGTRMWMIDSSFACDRK